MEQLTKKLNMQNNLEEEDNTDTLKLSLSQTQEKNLNLLTKLLEELSLENIFLQLKKDVEKLLKVELLQDIQLLT